MALDSLNLNSTSLAWIGFTYQLVDKTVFPPDFNFGLQGAHKGVAHFHPQSDPGQTGDPTYLTTAFSVVKDGDNETSIGLGNGTVDSGDEFRLKEALIHERNYKDAAGDPILRKFDLELTPQTPEPASMTLLAVGALCMAGYRWRRHRKAEIEKRRNSEIQNIRAKGQRSG